jgi:hypothetical protein
MKKYKSVVEKLINSTGMAMCREITIFLNFLEYLPYQNKFQTNFVGVSEINIISHERIFNTVSSFQEKDII